ncbi:MAG: beta strand repeat-containing protein [Candidatus Izemoplasmatales bacterium]
MKKLFLLFAALFIVTTLAACNNQATSQISHTVSFDTDGGNIISSQTVFEGGLVTKPTDPEKAGYVFNGFYNGNTEWNFSIDIVTSDLTLVAKWILVSSTPTNIVLTDDVFSSSITWTQTDASLQTFVVSVQAEGQTQFTVVTGDVTITPGAVLDTVVFTPDTLLGGYYTVKVSTGVDEATSESLLFGGAGTLTNPYLVSDPSDVLAILETPALADKVFLQMNDIISTLEDPIEINDARKISFSGTYDGDGYTLSFGGNGGLFHEITADGVVKNIVIGSTSQISAAETNLYSIGFIANTNYGLIENITSSGAVVNTRLQGALPVFEGTVDTTDLTTGAGAIVGVNGLGGVINDVQVSGSGAVKAGRGIGGVAAYNFGTITRAVVTATLAAGNQVNSGKSSNTYSYGGGIAGFNFGLIDECVVTGRVFAQSAISVNGDGNEGKNVAFGGIAGYNEGTISNSSFARSLDAKEFIDKSRADELADSTSNLGVASISGDIYVGGISGINAGTITNVYVGGAVIGGRDYIGGITGLTLGTGSISNSYVFAEVAVKDENGLKITEASDKTTVTTYEIAPSGFDAASTIYKALINSKTNATWVPGDLDSPVLPAFTADDLAKVGNQFSNAGVLKWQAGLVTGVNITLDSLVVSYGSTAVIEYAVTPSNAPDTFTIWTSSDDSIVEILGEGMIKGVSAGTATVTVTTRDGGFTDTIVVTVEDYVKIDTVTVTAAELTLPEANNVDDRLPVDIGTVITISVDILPLDAAYQNYTITTSNSRATVDGNTVSFVYGATGPGSVSVYVTFEDASIAQLNYRFTTVEPVVNVPLESVNVSAAELTLPAANTENDVLTVVIGQTATLSVSDFLPVNATNKAYTITTSNNRATVLDNVVTFVLGDGVGDVSILVTFEDSAIGELNYRFTTIEPVSITSVTVTADEITLPVYNDDTVRQEIEIGTTVTLHVTDILPGNATNQNYTITTSNSRATVDGNVVTFLYGSTGPGSVSIYVTFEDPAIGELNYRFTTVEPVVSVPISSVTVTCDEFTLPEVNNADIRMTVLIGQTATINVTEILPANATNQTYTITTSNSRATVEGNVVTFVYGDTGPGSVSIYVTFADSAIGQLNYRFTTTEPVNMTSATVSASEITLPEANNVADVLSVEIGTVATFSVTDILPANATYQGYTITASNALATVDGNVVTFVLGDGAGAVDIIVTFDDPTMTVLTYHFTTVAVAVTSVTVTCDEFTLPEVNNADIRMTVLIGQTATINVTEILPLNATNQNYTITTSNSRATVDGNVVTFVYGATGPGSVSIYVTFEDPAIGQLNYRFTTTQPA